jgi:flagellum-specific ATP synthase
MTVNSIPGGNHFLDRVANHVPYRVAGKVVKSVGMVFEAILPGASVGSICRILTTEAGASRPLRLDETSHELPGVDAEVIGFREKRVVLMPFGEARGISTDSLVIMKRSSPSIRVGNALLGRILDATGEPLDGKGPIDWGADETACFRPLYEAPSHPLERSVIETPLDLGVRALNGLLTIGRGQRVGIMAGSGVGKSVLLGMMARQTKADVNVIALIGERGREVREFIERDLGPEGLARSVVIVATSDKSPLLRMRGAVFAAAVAEFFRDQTKDVLLLMDSVTRFCMAQREIGLSLGEPPATKGYPPSVFSMLPKLLERAGTGVNGGSITGLYTVLVEGDDMDDPIADSARSILDGHIVLSRKIAQKNHFPAIDVLASASRVFRAVTDEVQQDCAGKIKEWMALYNQAEDLINIGAYAKGSNPKIDQAIASIDRINLFLRQKVDETGNFDDSRALMQAIVRVGEASSAGRRN